MEQNSNFADFTGAYSTPHLVGRTELLEEFDALIQRDSERSDVFFLSGQGGIGKTRVLKALLSRAQDNSNVLAPQEIVDLYHIQNHTIDGFIDAIWHVLPSNAAQEFRKYQRERRNYERMRMAGEIRGLAKQHERVSSAFLEELAALAKKHRLVILLDTAEKLLYTTSRSPAIPEEMAESWRWIAEKMTDLPNVVWVVAGRPQSTHILTVVDEAQANVSKREIAPFSQEESLAYFEAAIAATKAAEDEGVASRLAALDVEMRRAAHRYSGGLPIYLSLLIDYLSVAEPGTIPDDLKELPKEPSQDQAAGQLQQKIEELFVTRLIKGRGLGDTIQALGRAPKGVDVRLLSALLDVSLDEAQRRLDEVKKLSFVKVRPSDQRFFLHDVMYEILERHVFSQPADGIPAKKAGKTILDYYTNALTQVQSELGEIFRPVLEKGATDIDLTFLGQRVIERQALLAETVYYRLRQNPVRGYLRYYRYMREAILSGQVLLDLLLQTELITFWSERDPDETADEIAGIPRSILESTLALRPITRDWAQGAYSNAIEGIEKTRQRRKEFFSPERKGTKAIFEAWEAYARILIGDADNLTRADTLLTENINGLQPDVGVDNATTDEVREWRMKAVLAFCYRIRGYLYRVRGDLQSAVEDYRHATRLWRDTNFLIHQARTLNDMGFAMSELGDWFDARSLVDDALAILKGLGQFALAGLSINTLAMIEIRQGNYLDAQTHARQALSLFRALQFERGVGLALIALAEATRRYAGASSLGPEQKILYLRQARDFAQEAAAIFGGHEQENARRVEALIEVGCACRDWVNIRRQWPNPQDNVTRLKDESATALQEAARLAGDIILYRKVDALVNLAWLGYFAGDDSLMEQAGMEAEQAIPIEYRIDKNTGKPTISMSEAQRLLWPQMGKLFTVRGFHQFDQFENNKDPVRWDFLHRAIKEMCIGLEYSSFYSPNYQGINQAKNQIYQRMKKLNPEELTKVANVVSVTEAEIGLNSDSQQEGSEMRRFLMRRALWYGDQ